MRFAHIDLFVILIYPRSSAPNSSAQALIIFSCTAFTSSSVNVRSGSW
ncbi:hypothetical protein NBRC111894_586 [Sporolactobacillus inulinus]|uniref:Uncharacterized protein n=1 Tax=Sporolactobacillus inulinus TaxID=2078 RepID=A0A4Y1Z7M5_9BACL|nr:hypothetical protein NBRC111894_586 [Sporolactobacillus inulinus]